MSTTTMVIVGIIILGIIGYFIWDSYKKKNMEKLFNHVFETSKEVPIKKRKAFQLFMFKETLAASLKKGKNATSTERLNNEKYVYLQLINMTKILKDTSNIKDKTIKRALKMLEDYKKWEEKKTQ
ncbi:MAG: hypothetical protein U9N10_05815 [Bacillota bacterium]|nr:hypothetical protein [Bacillota bacterium]